MWSLRRLLFVRQTGSSLPILGMCGFRFWQFSGSGDHICQQISTKSHILWKSAMPTLYSMVTETANRNRILEMCEFRIWFRMGITSTILYWFSPNFASGSRMSSHRRIFVTQTGSSLLILEVCGFQFPQFSGSDEHIFQPISTRSHVQIKFGNADFVFDGNETGNRNRILERCKFRFWLVHWIDPRSIEHNYACCLSNALDRPSNQFFPSVSLCVC